MPITGPLKLFQTALWASIFRAPVDGGVVWCKACAPRQFLRGAGHADEHRVVT